MAESQPPAKAGSFIKSLEIDPRLLGMIGAFVLIALVFQTYTGIRETLKLESFNWNPLVWLRDGLYLTPRNIFNLTIQTVSVAIMSMGMVFIIVTRHIDLSVGSVLAVCSAIMAMLQVEWLPTYFGIPVGSPLVAPVTILAGLAVGTLLGSMTGYLSGYEKIPSFIVTLGGLMVWRQASWLLTGGTTRGPLDATIVKLGGAEGTLGVTWSWVAGICMAGLALWGIWAGRKSRIAHGFNVKPVEAEATLTVIIVGLILGFIAILNAYALPVGKLKRLYEARGEVMPEGAVDYHGLPISVFLLIIVAISMSIIARKTRLGRYIYATGGNPDAAELSGVNTKMLTVKVFAIMGFLCGLAALVSQARALNHANDIGTSDELAVIAAAVIGGTALAGGIGTIIGAILGAFVMQGLKNGMGLCNIDTPYQNIIVGVVLVLAVWLDIQFRKRRGAKL